MKTFDSLLCTLVWLQVSGIQYQTFVSFPSGIDIFCTRQQFLKCGLTLRFDRELTNEPYFLSIRSQIRRILFLLVGGSIVTKGTNECLQITAIIRFLIASTLKVKFRN